MIDPATGMAAFQAVAPQAAFPSMALPTVNAAGSTGMPQNPATGPGFLDNPANVMALISMMGQAGAAISPDDTIGRRLGGVAANMGSQKLQQMASQEAEKRTMEFYKELFKGKSPVEVEQIKSTLADPNKGPVGDLPSMTPASTGGISSNFNVAGPEGMGLSGNRAPLQNDRRW